MQVIISYIVEDGNSYKEFRENKYAGVFWVKKSISQGFNFSKTF